MNTTENIAEFVVATRYQDIPGQALELAKRSLLDTLAAASAGCNEPGAQAFMRYVKKIGGRAIMT